MILFNINHLFAQLNGLKYSKWKNSSIWHIDGTLTGTTILGHREHGSNGNEGVLYILQSSKTRTSPLDSLVLYSKHSLEVGLTSLQPQSTGWFYIRFSTKTKLLNRDKKIYKKKVNPLTQA